MAAVFPCVSPTDSRKAGAFLLDSCGKFSCSKQFQCLGKTGNFGRSFRKRSVRVRAKVDEEKAAFPADDYYAVLGLDPSATQEQIKKAYYSCMKACHPDLVGDNTGATNFCMFINEVYGVLSDPEQRMIYDEINGYSLKAQNPFLDNSCPKDQVFVDECTCIGCKNCVNTAPDTFAIEEDHGRARAISQCGGRIEVETAVETCPVDCIHWVSAPQLALLEDAMRRVERVNVGVMLSSTSQQGWDVFQMAQLMWEEKHYKTRERAREASASTSGNPWWQFMRDESPDSADDRKRQAQEKANRAAAAARRWREYARKGFYGQATQALAEEKQPTDSEN